MRSERKAKPWKRTQVVEERLKRLRVDPEDHDLLLTIPRWRPDPRGYVTRTVIDKDGKRTAEYLHRKIAERMIGRSLCFADKVDHGDRNPLNNLRSNLRVATNLQNSMNSPPRNGKRFKGTTPYFRDRSKWKAQIGIAGKVVNLGIHDTEEAAARAYDAKAYELAGSFAWLNFPDEWPS